MGLGALLLALPVLAAEKGTPVDPLADVLNEEVRRTISGVLRSGRQAPYFIAYQVDEYERVRIEATLGGLLLHERSPERKLAVEVRLGDANLDSGNFKADSGAGDGHCSTPLVLGADALAIQRSAWLITDACYKEAAHNLARKKSVRQGQRRTDPPPDFAPTLKSSVGRKKAAGVTDDAPLVVLARELSDRFRSHPDVEQSSVLVAWEAGRRLMIDNLGTHVSKPRSEFHLHILATTRAPDGATQSDYASWVLSSPDELPSRAALLQETDALIARLSAWRQAAPQVEEYLGPVLFEGQAAVDLWARLLAPVVSGTPPVEKGYDDPFDTDPSTPGLSLRRRVLPSGWSVWDDPTAEPGLPSSYVWDDEGQPAARVELVREGVVVGLLGSRTPGPHPRQSNGHARGSPGEPKRGLPSYLVVEPPQPLSPRKLYAAAAAAGEDVGRTSVLVIRRLENPSAQVRDNLRWTTALLLGATPALPTPVEMVLRDAAGHETPVRGLRFAEGDLRTLRGALAGGGAVQGVRMMQTDGVIGGFSATSGLPTTFRVPAVLLDELRLAPDTSETDPLPPVPSPLR